MRFFVFFFVLFHQVLRAQDNPMVVWQGIMTPDGKGYGDAQVLWLKIPMDATHAFDVSLLLSRQETFQTEFFALHKVTVKLEDGFIIVSEAKTHKKKLNRGVAFCRMTYKLKYNEKSGYLEGTYFSNDCRGKSGKIYLYKSEETLNENETVALNHIWVKKLIVSLEKGSVSPARMAEMRANFVFKPIYFDYDKAEIRDEFKSFLKEMAQIVLSHSDLRIKVTGHTDGDGSDAYNMDLSKRRAKAIVDFFVSQGLTADRIVIDFKGKREPVAPNNTSEGKQRNRRVDFEFV